MKNNNETEIIQVDDDKKVCIDGDDKTFRDHWVTEGSVILHLKDKQEILRGRKITDLQINAFQNLLKRQCKHVDGFMNTLLQQIHPLQLHEGKMVSSLTLGNASS